MLFEGKVVVFVSRTTFDNQDTLHRRDEIK